MAEKVYKVLFLCTGNSARSIMAEAILKRMGAGRFDAFSAGSQPRGEVHPLALETLREANHALDGYRSKSWTEFAHPEAPKLDFLFTVCGNAANETCPVWPGRPITAHWGIEDPAAVDGPEGERRRAFHDAYMALDARIKLFTSLPLEKLDLAELQERLVAIGAESARSSRT
jgi:protein-tyrosine-phosphatase